MFIFNCKSSGYLYTIDRVECSLKYKSEILSGINERFPPTTSLSPFPSLPVT